MSWPTRIPHVEQISKDWTTPAPGARRFWKRRTARLMRRIGRALLDEAPRRLPLRGYTD